MPEKRVPDELDEYLRGDSALSRQYRRESAAAPPHALDRLVLGSASRSAKSKVPLRSQSLAPLAFAASVLLSVALVLAIVFGPQGANKPDEPRVLKVSVYKTDPPRAALSSPRERNPAVWLADIAALRRAGRDSEAESEMRRFRSAYPDYLIPVSE